MPNAVREKRKIRPGCLLLMFAQTFAAIAVGGLAFWTTRPSVDEPPFLTDRAKREAEMIAGFSFATSDPATYWGERTVSAHVDHETFDTIIVNPLPYPMFGDVVVGMRDGKIVCYYLYAHVIPGKKLVINGKTVEWPWRRFRIGKKRIFAMQRNVEFSSILATAAEKLTAKEVDDLAELARLVHENYRAMETPRVGLADFESHFNWSINKLVEIKRQTVAENGAGTSSVKPEHP